MSLLQKLSTELIAALPYHTSWLFRSIRREHKHKFTGDFGRVLHKKTNTSFRVIQNGTLSSGKAAVQSNPGRY